MKKISATLLLIIMLTCISTFAQESPTIENTEGKFSLTVVGFDSNEGKVMIALFNSEESYSETGENFKAVALEIKEQKCEWLIKDLPFGEYAIKLFHDENENGRMDRNMFGMPTEDYAFSNNAAGNFGPAEYEDAKFAFNASGQTHKISID